MFIPPILDNKRTSKPSVFAPAALLGEARRQKGLDSLEVPPVCILDPDGDLARRLRQTGLAMPFSGTSFWPTGSNRTPTRPGAEKFTPPDADAYAGFLASTPEYNVAAA